jgi:hypothetical protein
MAGLAQEKNKRPFQILPSQAPCTTKHKSKGSAAMTKTRLQTLP